MSVRTLCAIGAALLLGVTPGAKAAVSADVPYVPTPWNVVETMFDMAKVTAADHLIDLGSGDGRIVIEAVKKRGARACPERIIVVEEDDGSISWPPKAKA